MYHLFRATLLGYDREQEGIYFDANHYSREEAEAQFKPYDGVTQRGYPYTGYEFGGSKYHDVSYIGEFPNKKSMPKNNDEYLDYLIAKGRKR